MNEIRRGWRTSEYWVTMLNAVGATAAAIGGVLSPATAAWISALSGVAYAVARGLAKVGK